MLKDPKPPLSPTVASVFARFFDELGKAEIIDPPALLAAAAKETAAKSSVEQWMINKAVHYNAWANLQKDEFATVADAFRCLLATMQCTNPECRDFLYVTPPKGEMKSLRCGCGDVNFNLVSKKKSPSSAAAAT